MQVVLSDEELLSLFRDDVPYGDLTSDLLIGTEQVARAQFLARHEMVVCGVEEAARLCQLLGAQTKILVHSGDRVSKDTELLRVKGPARTLFAAWKVCQTLMEWSSGVATATRDLADSAAPVPVVCTRKSIPGVKALSIKAVRMGGGSMHRLGLSESLLVFAEHRQFGEQSPEALLNYLRGRAPEQRRVVEVQQLKEAFRWAQAGAEVLQMDKFTPEQVRLCADFCAGHQLPTVLAVAGGIQAHNAQAYVKAGAQLLVTSAPYYALPKDVQVRFETVQVEAHY